MKTRTHARGFSLVELVIVVVIIGVIAAIAVPRISRGARGAGESALRGSLTSLRNAIDMYAAEHSGAFPGGDGLPDTFIAQLTKRTTADGTVDEANGTFGPYLRRGLPPAPVGAKVGNNKVKLTNQAIVIDAAADAGWVYNYLTGEIIVNSDALAEDGTTTFNEF